MGCKRGFLVKVCTASYRKANRQSMGRSIKYEIAKENGANDRDHNNKCRYRVLLHTCTLVGQAFSLVSVREPKGDLTDGLAQTHAACLLAKSLAFLVEI